MYRRKFALDKCTPTLTVLKLFYSRIILKKLSTENKSTFGKLEKSVKFGVKRGGDIKFINVNKGEKIHINEIIPHLNATNFKLLKQIYIWVIQNCKSLKKF